MTGTEPAVIRLSELRDGDEAVCFAALVKRERGVDKYGRPFLKCQFRDKRVNLVAPLWASNPLREKSEAWVDGNAYRLHLRASADQKYGLQLDILDIREAVDGDAADGYDFNDLVDSSRYPADTLCELLQKNINKYIDDPRVRRLVERILDEHGALFRKMPAAQNFHHSFTGGLLEHVWSMTRVAGFLADHYAKYYSDLNPPLNKGVIVAAAILHDIGKLRELEYHPVEARYTKEGSLIGHVLMGRDLVRETARSIGDFPEETLLLLEHAILAHHGKEEFGAPKAPQTLEALIVHYADDLDSKVNAVARQRLRSTTSDEFTERVFALNNRRFYKGIPVEPPDDDVAALP